MLSLGGYCCCWQSAEAVCGSQKARSDGDGGLCSVAGSARSVGRCTAAGLGYADSPVLSCSVVVAGARYLGDELTLGARCWGDEIPPGARWLGDEISPGATYSGDDLVYG